MLKSCKYCGRVHRVDEVCPKKPKRFGNWSKYNSPERKFRSTQAWQTKREEIKERDHYLCKVCLDYNVINYNGLEVHHIVSLKDDFDKRLDNDNLITLCRTHHEEAERGQLSIEYLTKLIEDDARVSPPGVADGFFIKKQHRRSPQKYEIFQK